MDENLKAIRQLVRENIAEWEERTGEKRVAPYPADTPCYYCRFNEYSPDGKIPFNACDYCIHNHEAKFFDEVQV